MDMQVLQSLRNVSFELEGGNLIDRHRHHVEQARLCRVIQERTSAIISSTTAAGESR